MKPLDRRTYQLPYREQLTVKTQSTTTAEAFSFRFEHGWAVFTVNEATGELSVQSDWGNASFRWRVDALGNGDKLKAFLARTNADYVTGKLAMGVGREWKDVFWRDETERQMKHEVLRLRRDRGITKIEASDAWRAVDEFCSQADSDGIDAAYINADGDALGKVFCELHEWIVMHDAPRRVFFETVLIPFFIGFMREHVRAAEARP